MVWAHSAFLIMKSPQMGLDRHQSRSLERQFIGPIITSPNKRSEVLSPSVESPPGSLSPNFSLQLMGRFAVPGAFSVPEPLSGASIPINAFQTCLFVFLADVPRRLKSLCQRYRGHVLTRDSLFLPHDGEIVNRGGAFNAALRFS